jgi:WD40 repeat protein
MVPMPPVAISADNPVVELARWQASSTVMDVAFSPDGKILASADGNGVTFWDVSTGEQLGSLKHDSSPNHIAFSPDGKLLASTVPSEGTVYLWDIASNKILYTFKNRARRYEVWLSLRMAENSPPAGTTGLLF